MDNNEDRIIVKITDRHPSGLVATCEICGMRGASEHVPYKVEYAAEYGSGKSGDITFRCKAHKPVSP